MIGTWCGGERGGAAAIPCDGVYAGATGWMGENAVNEDSVNELSVSVMWITLSFDVTLSVSGAKLSPFCVETVYCGALTGDSNEEN